MIEMNSGPESSDRRFMLMAVAATASSNQRVGAPTFFRLRFSRSFFCAAQYLQYYFTSALHFSVVTISEKSAIVENSVSNSASSVRRFSRNASSSAITSTRSKKSSTAGRNPAIA